MGGLSADRLAALAVQAALHEAAAPGKPGLVCADSQGAHSDMDITTMLASALCLEPFFRKAAELGQTSASETPQRALAALRANGVAAEQRMFAVTGGVNTHKGLVFSMSLLAAAAGRSRSVQPEAVCATAAAFVQGVTARDFAVLAASDTQDETVLAQRLQRRLTAGERLYLRHGVTGIRGEAEAGFPLLVPALCGLRGWLGEGLAFNAALLNTLVWLMARVTDTNVLWRGGLAALSRVQREAGQVLAAGGVGTAQGAAALGQLQATCLEQRLSPGGSADLLSLVLFFHLAASSPA